jgi:CIC family chloride channel protein
LVPVKFLGGLLAIGALGREGPQMGASLAHLVGRLFRRPWADCRELIAAGAGAGLATAFNAPIAGAVFVLEELVQRFEHRIAIAALGASATAITVARLLLGDAPDFSVATLPHGDAATRPLYFVFGALAGLMAVAYNFSAAQPAKLCSPTSTFSLKDLRSSASRRSLPASSEPRSSSPGVRVRRYG